MDWIEARIEAISRDRRHGAAQLAARAVQILMAVCRRTRVKDLESLTLIVKQTAITLSRTRPSMAPIRNWCFVFAHRFQQLSTSGVSMGEAKRQGVLLGKELLGQQQRFLQQQIQAAHPLLARSRSVVTLSYSSTVESIFRRGLPPDCRVHIAESRPLMEGRLLFKRLQESVIDLRMITDVQLGLVIPNADLVLVGADTVLRDLAVVNKTGTYIAALVAHTHSRDFFVAADTYKINAAVDSRNCVLESKSGKEVWQNQEKQCNNVYFDITPGQLITGYVSEEGILDAPAMRAHVQRWQQLAEAFDYKV